MSQTLQIINMIVLIIVIGFALYSLTKSDRARKQKQEEDEAETKRWERGAEIASQDNDYNQTIPQEKTNLQGKPYDRDEWRYIMPDAAIKHLQECFEGNGHKVHAMKRSIELSIEHYTYEMEDDSKCARIIEERVYSNPKDSILFDIEEYRQYAQEREAYEKEFESFSQWKNKRTEVKEYD